MGAEETGSNMVIFKHRSNYRCFRDGAALVMKNFNAMFKHLWPFVLVFMVFAIVLFYYQRVAVVDILAGNLWPSQAYAMCLSLFAWVAALLYHSVVVWQQRSLITTGTLPKEKLRLVWRELLHSFWRVIKIAVIFGIIGIVLFIVGYLLYVIPLTESGVESSSTIGSWLVIVMGWLIATCLLLIFIGVAYQVCFEYLLGGTSLKVAFNSLRWSRRYFGRNMLMALASLLVAAVVVAFFSVPTIICSYIDAIALEMKLNEEVAELPSYYFCVSVLAWFLTALGYFLATLFVSFPLLFNWGAVHATESKRQEQSASELLSSL